MKNLKNIYAQIFDEPSDSPCISNLDRVIEVIKYIDNEFKERYNNTDKTFILICILGSFKNSKIKFETVDLDPYPDKYKDLITGVLKFFESDKHFEKDKFLNCITVCMRSGVGDKIGLLFNDERLFPSINKKKELMLDFEKMKKK